MEEEVKDGYDPMYEDFKLRYGSTWDRLPGFMRFLVVVAFVIFMVLPPIAVGIALITDVIKL